MKSNPYTNPTGPFLKYLEYIPLQLGTYIIFLLYKKNTINYSSHLTILSLTRYFYSIILQRETKLVFLIFLGTDVLFFAYCYC